MAIITQNGLNKNHVKNRNSIFAAIHHCQFQDPYESHVFLSQDVWVLTQPPPPCGGGAGGNGGTVEGRRGGRWRGGGGGGSSVEISC